jgi:hypothetical protein
VHYFAFVQNNYKKGLSLSIARPLQLYGAIITASIASTQVDTLVGGTHQLIDEAAKLPEVNTTSVAFAPNSVDHFRCKVRTCATDSKGTITTS